MALAKTFSGATLIASLCSHAAEPVTPAPAAAPNDRCATGEGATVLARVPARPCGWLLRQTSNEPPIGLQLESLEPERASSIIAGEAPPVCAVQRCEYEIIPTRWGPLPFALEPSPHSEMPARVHGAVVETGKLAFVDLWEGSGDDVVIDGTPVGSAFTLWPHRCGEHWGLFVVPRIDVAATEPDPELLAREGIYSVENGAAIRLEAGDRSACEPIEAAPF
jgi:hypothetical protein